MKHIPMCWKCASVIKGKNSDGSFTVKGCKESDKVKDYDTAQKYCPIMKQLG